MHRQVHLQGTVHSHSTAVHALTTYSAVTLWDVDSTYRGHCTCPVQLKCTLRVHCASMRKLLVNTSCALCTCDSLYSVKCTCMTQCTMHVNCIMCTRCTVQCTYRALHVQIAVCGASAMSSVHQVHYGVIL